MRHAAFLVALLCCGCVSQREYDAMRDRESGMASKSELSALITRIDAEEKQDYQLATKAEIEVVKGMAQNISENVTKNTVGRSEFESISKDVQANRDGLRDLNSAISVMKSVGAVCGTIIGVAITAIGIWKGRSSA